MIDDFEDDDIDYEEALEIEPFCCDYCGLEFDTEDDCRVITFDDDSVIELCDEHYRSFEKHVEIWFKEGERDEHTV